MKLDNYISLLSKTMKSNKAINQSFLIKANSKKRIYLTLLNIRIADFVESVICLYNSNLFPAITILFRSVVEANLDFENLLRDDNYMKDLDYRYFSEWERLFGSSKMGNPFLSGILSNETTSEMVELISKEYDLLKKEGYKGLTIKERFDKVNQSSIYYSIYNISCCESHNNLRALFDWNTVTHEDGSESINYCSENNNGLLPYLDNITAIFINSTIQLVNYSKEEVDKELGLLSQELEALRKNSA